MRYEGKEVERENQAEITNKIPGDCDMGFLRVSKVCAHDGSACVGWGMPLSAIPFSLLRVGARPALVLLCLLLCPGLSAYAAPRSVGDWVVEVPAGWKTQEEGNQVLLSSPKEDCYVTMLEKDCFNGDLDLLAKASASVTGGNDLRTLGEGKGVVFADKIARYWVGLADDKYMEVSVGHACRGVGPIAKSLKISPKAKNAAPLNKLLAVAQGPENTRWLVTGDRPDDARPVEPADPTGDRPDFAALADLAAPARAPHEKTIPEGWRTTHTGQWTIYDKPGEKVWYAVGLYPLRKVENGKWGTDLIDLARKLKGINITTGEGTVDFYTREGGIGTVLTNDANTVVELYYPEDDANLAELREALH